VRDQIVSFDPLICTARRRITSPSNANHGNCKGWLDSTLSAARCAIAPSFSTPLSLGDRCDIFLHHLLAQVTAISTLDPMYLFIGFRESTPPQDRQLNILISNSKREVDDLVGDLAF